MYNIYDIEFNNGYDIYDKNCIFNTGDYILYGYTNEGVISPVNKYYREECYPMEDINKS